MNYLDGDEYDYKPFPGNHERGAEQFKGTPEEDNYKQNRAPAMAGVKRSTNKITPLAALVGYTGTKRDLSSAHNETEELTLDDKEMLLSRKTMGSIREEFLLDNETMYDDVTLDDKEKDVVKRVFFNKLIKKDDVDEENDEDIPNGYTEASGSGSGEDAEKRTLNVESSGEKREAEGDRQVISGNSPLEDSVIHGPEAGISRVFIEPMIVRKRNQVFKKKPLDRLSLFRKAIFFGE